MSRSEKYGPEVKYKKGLDELLEALAEYQEPDGASSNPYKFLYELLASGRADILELGSGWEKEAVDAVAEYGKGINWISLNPMLADPDHNVRVIEQIEDHAWSPHIQRALSNMGIEAPPRKAVAAVSPHLPFRDKFLDLVLASWSVPTVLEEQIASRVLSKDRREYSEVEHASDMDTLNNLIHDTCAEYSRVLKPGGVAITFPIRDPNIVDRLCGDLDSIGKWEHIICVADDYTQYAVDDSRKNYLVMSRLID